METRGDYKTRFKPIGKKPLSRRIVGVRVEPEIESALNCLPHAQRSEWLRRVISEAVRRELINTECIRDTDDSIFSADVNMG